MLARIFRVLRATNDVYGLAIFWLYVLLFVFTFSLIFVFPPGALLLVFLGLAGLGVVIVVGGLLRWIQRAVAKSILRRGSCPRCADAGVGAPASGYWECRGCGASFTLSGSARELESAEIA